MQSINSRGFALSGITTLDLSASKSLQKVSTMSFAMTGLESVTIGAAPDGVFFGANAFASNTNLRNVTILTPMAAFGGDTVVQCPNLEAFIFTRTAISIVGLPTVFGFKCRSISDSHDANLPMCGCDKGFEDLLPQSSPVFSCTPCSPGFYNSDSVSQGMCEPCTPGRYASTPGLSSCELCEAGKYGLGIMEISESACIPCLEGKYAPTTGSSECLRCPSGSACPSKGTATYVPCERGYYNSYQGKTECLPCPGGTYSNSTGSAVCEGCPQGKHFSGTGSTSALLCVDCPAGRFGDKVGLANCTACPTGQYQPSAGGQQCDECTDIAVYKTNNAEHTGCIDNEDLLGDSMAELLFRGNTAYYVSFAISAVFVALSGVMHFLRDKYGPSGSAGGLGQLQHWQVLIKAALPGFSFGSELMLMVAIFSEKPPLAIAMVFFRLLHVWATVLVVTCLLGSAQTTRYISNVLPDASNWEKAFNFDFAKTNIPIVGAILLLCACDVSLVQLLPWSDTPYYAQSVGYPSRSMMRFASGVDLLQVGVSVICTITYLASTTADRNPTTSGEARSLFALNITVSILTLIISSVVMFLKDRLLHKGSGAEAWAGTDTDKDTDTDTDTEAGTGTGRGTWIGTGAGSGSKEEPATSNDRSITHRSSATIELGGVYGAGSSDMDNHQQDNPMHAAAAEAEAGAEAEAHADAIPALVPAPVSAAEAGALRERILVLEREVEQWESGSRGGGDAEGGAVRL